MELDQVKPLSSFDIKDIEQIKQASHYSNVQPLLAKDKRAISNKYQEYDLWLQSENLYDCKLYKYYSQI